MCDLNTLKIQEKYSNKWRLPWFYSVEVKLCHCGHFNNLFSASINVFILERWGSTCPHCFFCFFLFFCLHFSHRLTPQKGCKLFMSLMHLLVLQSNILLLGACAWPSPGLPWKLSWHSLLDFPIMSQGGQCCTAVRGEDKDETGLDKTNRGTDRQCY